jgi:hypothetical protein
MSALAVKQPQQYSDPTPQTLIPVSEGASSYPLDALGDILGSAAKAMAKSVQVPPEMAAQSVLAAAALAVQPFADASLDGRVYPLSLFMLTVAGSGDRKSGVDKVATAPHKNRQRELYDSYDEEYQRFQNEIEAYEISRKSAVEKSKKNGQEAIAMALHELGLPPEAPKLPTLLSQEPTAEGLVKSLFSGLRSQGLFSDEGGSFFGGHSMRDDNRLKSIAILSQLWDGSDINRTRAGAGESMTVKNPRLSAHLMIQPVVSERIFSDKELTGQGFLARFLIASPQSIAGTRFYQGTDLTFDQSVINYQNLMTSLLKQPLPLDASGTLCPRLLEVNSQSKELWKEAYNAIEGELAPKLQLADVKPTAAKMAEQIIRISGVLTMIKDPNAIQIEADNMERAIKLGSWYLEECLRLNRTSNSNCDYITASKVIDWIMDKKLVVVTVNDINKNKVAKLNGANKCREILHLIEDNHWLIKLPPETMINGRTVKEAWRLNRNIGRIA